jgi:hypothetical protein
MVEFATADKFRGAVYASGVQTDPFVAAEACYPPAFG